MTGRPQVRLSTGALAVFGTRTLGLVLAAGTTFLLAKTLGPADLGGYYLLILIPSSALALLSIGLPSALTYFSGRGEDLDQIRSLAVLLALVLSILLIGATLAASGILAATILAAAPASMIPLAAAAIPGVFVVGFSNAVILGRQRLRTYNAVLLGQSAALFAGQVIVVVLLRGGLVGALATYVAVWTGAALVAVIAMLRLEPYRPSWDTALARRLLSYGVRLIPATLSGFFSYRADVFLLSALTRDPAILGVYGLAVNVAELCFYVPDAVATVLFPRVASASREASAAMVPMVSRVTIFLTGTVALALGLGSIVALPVILPAFAPSVLPTVLLLPGIVGLSASKVLSGYLSGIGRPGPVSSIATLSLILNLVANVLLIPHFGASGAAFASLLSYSLNGVLMVAVSARQARAPRRRMLLLRRDDLGILATVIRSTIRLRSA